MSGSLSDFGDFVDLCKLAEVEARRRDAPVIVSWCREEKLTDWIQLFDAACDCSSRSFFWESRWSELRILGAGSALDLPGVGSGRFDQVEDALKRYGREVITDGMHSGVEGSGPLFVGGFAFRSTGRLHPGGWPDALVWLPAVQVVRKGSGPALFTLNACLTPGSDPLAIAEVTCRIAAAFLRAAEIEHSHREPLVRDCDVQEYPTVQDWKALVTSALEDIDRGLFTKVVLARELLVHSPEKFDVSAALDYLDQHFPHGAVFAVRDHGSCFMGASPEYLVRERGNEVETLSLAGSAPRGADARHDVELEHFLLESPKLRREQAIVTEVISTALREVCSDVETMDTPAVLKLPNVQHLSTSVHGTLATNDAMPLLDLASLLHPSPAVGGYPHRPALDWLKQHETFDRGWYAGPVGWMDTQHDGEMAVAIRSGTITGSTAELYAGCGVVEGSEPELELAETDIKLAPMLAALGVAANSNGLH